MSSPLKNRIADDVKTAMRERDRERLATLRLISAAIKQREVDERAEMADADVLAVLDKMLKQRRDSIAQFEAAGRDDLVAQEVFEVGVIETYMPAALDESAIDEAIAAAVSESGATGIRDIGKVMGLLKGRLQGRADLGAVSARVREKLASTS